MNPSKLNWLRAGVLGANDGIISVSVVLVSIIGILSHFQLALVGISAIVAGALSMAIGEYVSVSAQRDAEKAWKQQHLTNPFHAAVSSFLAFVAGALIPFLAAIALHHVVAVITAVLVALLATTWISVQVGNVKGVKPFIRNLVAGGLALGVGVLVNTLFSV